MKARTFARTLPRGYTVLTSRLHFSDASTTTNEENMLVIRGDNRVADIYLGEFMRSFAHYAFREAVFNRVEAGGEAEDWKPQFLIDSPSWLKGYLKRGSGAEMKRKYFSGQ
ncbi:MAG TPA: hypothetical protein VMF03_04940 [Steroidobacteraceae bacterium]|nr:hypothetical protein [Steroidobacteraceae bacterium]